MIRVIVGSTLTFIFIVMLGLGYFYVRALTGGNRNREVRR